MEELHVILRACGTPSDPYMLELLEYWFHFSFHVRNKNVHFPEYPPNLQAYLQEKATSGKICKASRITDEVMSLLLDMLQVVPSMRKTAEEVSFDRFDEL